MIFDASAGDQLTSVISGRRGPHVSQKPLSRYRWELFAAFLATLIVAIALPLAIRITSQTSASSTTENQSPPTETVTIAPPSPETVTVDVDKGTNAAHTAKVPIPTVSVAIPNAIFDKLGPPHDSSLKWLAGPLATILAAVGAAGATIYAAGRALRGVLKQVEATLKQAEDKWMDDRLDDVWERFTWVVDGDRGKLLDWDQRKDILEALGAKASELNDPQLGGIIRQWLSDRVQAIYIALLRSEDPKAPHASLSELLMIGSPADAIKAAKIVVADRTLSKDIRDKAQVILNHSDQLQNVTTTKGPPPEPPPNGDEASTWGEVPELSRADHELAYYSAP